MPEDDLRNGVALIFRRKAKDLLTEREFVFSASMDLRWFSYTDAMKFLELAISSGLIRREGKAITPTFDFRKLELPTAFKPSAELVKEKAGAGPGQGKETMFIRLVDGKIISDELVAHPLAAGSPRPEEVLESRLL